MCFRVSIIWTLSLFLCSAFVAECCLQVLSGEVGGGNYTYYRLSHEGNVQLLLESLVGDADIYVSQSTLQPTFYLDSYDLCSVTCGLDQVDIPASFTRPVGIAVYGYGPFVFTSYELCVNLLPDDPYKGRFERDEGRNERDMGRYEREEGRYERHSYDQEADEEEEDERKSKPHVRFNYSKEDEEDSLLWTILIGVLRVIVEIFM